MRPSDIQREDEPIPNSEYFSQATYKLLREEIKRLKEENKEYMHRIMQSEKDLVVQSEKFKLELSSSCEESHQLKAQVCEMQNEMQRYEEVISKLTNVVKLQKSKMAHEDNQEQSVQLKLAKAQIVSLVKVFVSFIKYLLTKCITSAHNN